MPSLDEINDIVAEICADTVKEPLTFFNEADLQVRLSSMLRAKYERRIQTKVNRGAKSKGKYATGLVHNEYGAEKGRRIDIVVFSDKQAKTIDNYRLQCKGKYLKPQFAIELGTESVTDVGDHLESDVAKLHDQVSERGFVIHFYRDTALADTGTRSRIATDESIKQRFKRHIQDCRHDPKKVVILAFVIRLAHTHKTIWGKCEFYRPNCKRRWKKTNLEKLRERIKSF